MGRSTPTTAFDGVIWYFAYTIKTLLILCMKNSGWIFFEQDSYENLDNFPLYGFCICMDSAFMGRSTPTTTRAIWYFAYEM